VRRPSLLLLLALAVAAAATIALTSLGGDPTHQATPSVGETPAAPSPPVRILLDGAEVARVDARALRERKTLSSFLPEGARDMASWRVLAARSEQNGHFSVPDPATRFDDHVVWLYLAEHTWPAVGVFRRVHPSMSEALRHQIDRPTVFLVKVVEVDVWTHEPPVEQAPAPRATLTIAVAGREKETVLGAADLEALPTATASVPGEGGTGGGSGDSGRGRGRERGAARSGWHLGAVISRALPVGLVANARLVGEAGRTLDVAGDDLRDEGVLPLLRFNQRGTLAFDLTGRNRKGQEVAGRLREVKRIEVTPNGAATPPPAPTARPPVDVVALARAASQGELHERLTAISMLARAAPDPEARDDLVRLLDDPLPAVRSRAIDGLGHWLDCTDIVYAHLQAEKEVDVQRACLRVLGRRAGPALIQDLTAWRDRDDRVGKEAEKAIRRIAKRHHLPDPGR
jgi:hypothetical protein